MPFPEYFPLSELVKSETATRLGIVNAPNADQLANLEWGANFILTPIRILLGTPITITSGFRASGVNVRDHGITHSQHMQGCAADISPAGWSLSTAAEEIRKSDIPYDQLILEDECVHVSWVSLSPAKKQLTPRKESWRRHGNYPNWSYKPVTSFL